MKLSINYGSFKIIKSKMLWYISVNGFGTLEYGAKELNINENTYENILLKYNGIKIADNIAIGFEEKKDAEMALNDIKLIAILSGHIIEDGENI